MGELNEKLQFGIILRDLRDGYQCQVHNCKSVVVAATKYFIKTTHYTKIHSKEFLYK